MQILDLEPKEVWNYFNEILQIPRASKKEEKILAYLHQFAEQHKLAAKSDTIGNIVIRKPGTAGKEQLPTVILQSHVDMVCEKNHDVEHNFDTDPIQYDHKDGWITGKGTTLGADNGIGIATQMALLASKDIPHPPLECLFTVDEEMGLNGAFNLEPGMLSGKILINLDSEEEGEVIIGCAGGVDTLANFKLELTPAKPSGKAFKLALTGLKGGHSGTDIDNGFANAVKLMARLLWHSTDKFDLQLASLNAGNLRNAIPREGYAMFIITDNKEVDFLNFYNEFVTTIKNEYAVTDPNIKFDLTPLDSNPEVLAPSLQQRLLHALYSCPHGVIGMNPTIPGLVDTSTNLASVKIIENRIEAVTSQRSSMDTAKRDIASQIRALFELAGATVNHTDGYPGWNPNPDSALLKITEQAHKDLFGKEAKVLAIHAGLECGLFLEKYPDLDMVSIGPSIYFPHSPDEKVEINSVRTYWELLLEMLNRIS